jgi:predicted transposase YbfD/YdcC
MVPSLYEVLLELPDFRQAKGKRHELAKVLIVIVLGLLCGQNSLRQIAQWGQSLPPALKRRLGNRHGQMPSYGTLRRVLSQLDGPSLARCLQVWAEALTASLPPSSALPGLALDGKCLRGSGQPDADKAALRVLNAALHGTALVLGSQAIAPQTNEIGALPAMLASLCLTGRVVTTDAMLTQRVAAQTILQKDGHYCLRLKGNQPDTLAAVQAWFHSDTAPVLPDTQTFRLSQKGHGRLTTYTIQSTTALNPYLEKSLAWPRIGQVLHLQRHTLHQKTGTVTETVHYALTDLSPDQADPLSLFHLWQQHWHIENKLHWVRDVDFTEDRNRARTGHFPFNFSGLRNAVLNLLRAYVQQPITQARTYFSVNLPLACSLVGLPLVFY